METLKFVMTAAFYPPYHLGGDANHVRYLAEALVAQGHEVHVEYSPAALALKRGRPDTHDGGDGGVIRHPIPALTGRFQPLGAWIFGAPASVRRHHHELVEGVRPDVIHYHNLSLLGLDLIDVPSSALKMYTAHDYWVRCPRNDLFKFNQRLCEKPTCLTCLTISGKPPQLWRYRPDGLKPFDALDVAIAPSATRRMRERALSGFRRSGTRMRRSSRSRRSPGVRPSWPPRPALFRRSFTGTCAAGRSGLPRKESSRGSNNSRRKTWPTASGGRPAWRLRPITRPPRTSRIISE